MRLLKLGYSTCVVGLFAAALFGLYILPIVHLSERRALHLVLGVSAVLGLLVGALCTRHVSPEWPRIGRRIDAAHVMSRRLWLTGLCALCGGAVLWRLAGMPSSALLAAITDADSHQLATARAQQTTLASGLGYVGAQAWVIASRWGIPLLLCLGFVRQKLLTVALLPVAWLAYVLAAEKSLILFLAAPVSLVMWWQRRRLAACLMMVAAIVTVLLLYVVVSNTANTDHPVTEPAANVTIPAQSEASETIRSLETTQSTAVHLSRGNHVWNLIWDRVVSVPIQTVDASLSLWLDKHQGHPLASDPPLFSAERRTFEAEVFVEQFGGGGIGRANSVFWVEGTVLFGAFAAGLSGLIAGVSLSALASARNLAVRALSIGLVMSLVNVGLLSSLITALFVLPVLWAALSSRQNRHAVTRETPLSWKPETLGSTDMR